MRVKGIFLFGVLFILTALKKSFYYRVHLGQNFQTCMHSMCVLLCLIRKTINQLLLLLRKVTAKFLSLISSRKKKVHYGCPSSTSLVLSRYSFRLVFLQLHMKITPFFEIYKYIYTLTI